MLNKLVTLYFLTVTFSSIDCGNSFKSSPRILNGSDSVVNQFPYYVFLEIELSDGVKVCGGSLIDKQWILTAAHCISEAKEVLIALGTYQLRNSLEAERIIEWVSRKHLYIHPFYIGSISWNDIGLVKLPKPIQFNEFVVPISLPINCESNEFKKAIVMGQGLTSKTSRILPEVLQYAQLKTISLDECKSILPILKLRKSVLCARGENGQSFYTGDDGGALVSKNVQIGISSFVHNENQSTSLLQIFTDVRPYLRWIGRVTGLKLPKF